MELCGITLFRGNFSLSTTLLWTNLFEPENAQTRRKHEKKTKKTRKKHEILRIFRLTKEKIIGLKQPVDRCKNQWSKLDHWNQRVKMTRWNQRLKKSLWSGWKPTTPPRAKMARGLNFIAGCDEVALKNATSYFFGKPIDKIRSVWYTLIKEVEVLL